MPESPEEPARVARIERADAVDRGFPSVNLRSFGLNCWFYLPRSFLTK